MPGRWNGHGFRFERHLTPATGAYREIWIDGEPVAGQDSDESEPIYGKTYLPRKFKAAIALPPNNDVDIFSPGSWPDRDC